MKPKPKKKSLANRVYTLSEKDPAYGWYDNPLWQFVKVFAGKSNFLDPLVSEKWCREELCQDVFEDPSLITALTRLSVSVMTDKPVKEELKNGVDVGIKILNSLERKNSWRTTNMYPVKAEHDSKGFFKGYVFTDQPRWLKSPQAVSLFVLIFRSSHYIAMKYGKVKLGKTYKSVDDLICRWVNSRTNNYSASNTKKHMKIVFPAIDPFMKNFRELYKNLAPWNMKRYPDPEYKRYPESFDADDGRYSFFNEGITRLVTMNSNYATLSKRFGEIVLPKANKRAAALKL